MSLPQSKRCLKCDETKPLIEGFAKDRNSKDGHQGWCRPCAADHRRYWVKNNPEAARAKNRKAKLAMYGLTPGGFEELWESQKGLCPICSVALARKPGDHHVDHNHATNTVRAILCKHCNVGLGMFKDSPAVLGSAIIYLKSYGHYGPQALEGPAAP